MYHLVAGYSWLAKLVIHHLPRTVVGVEAERKAYHSAVSVYMSVE